MANRSITDEQEPGVAQAYEAGATIRELAAEYGCSTTGIIAALRRANVPPRSTKETRALRRGWGREGAEAEALRMYHAGQSVRQLARHFSVRTAVISDLLQRRHVPLHAGGRDHPRFRTLEQCEEVAALYREGGDLVSL